MTDSSYGSSALSFNVKSFGMIATLLRLSTKYQVEHLRRDLLNGLKPFWPATLSDWDAREARATNAQGIYEPQESIPHSMWASCFAP
jgi:hypothetical protein